MELPAATGGPGAGDAPAAAAHEALVPSCVHCGFCLPACPTYDLLGTEMDSPRGRLHLMRALEQGRIAPTEPVVRHLDLCLGCRACESACPSGVPYGAHLEEARARVRLCPTRPTRLTRLERLVLAAVAQPPDVQRVGWLLLRLLDRLRLPRRVARRSRRLHRRHRGAGRHGGAGSPPGGRADPLGAAAWLLVAAPMRATKLPDTTPPRGRQRLRVGLLTGCVQRWLFGDVNAATARLLAAAGCEVVVPPAQRCCGALHAHSGDREGAARLARANLAAFEEVGRLDAVVVNAAGCGSTMKAWGTLLADDPVWAGRAAAFAARTKDALELLDELGLPPPRRTVRSRVAYHHACHLAHAQGVRDAPLRLLASLPGVQLLPLQEADRCCGSAGIYNVLHPQEGEALLAEKIDRIVASGADVVAAANPGCLLQIAAGLRRRHLAITARHPVEILDEACR